MEQKLQPTSIFRHLLTLVLVFSGIIGSSASAASIKIEFLANGGQNGSEFKTETKVSEVFVASSLQYVDVEMGITAATRAYYNSQYGVNFATGSGAGSLAFNLSAKAQKTITKIDVEACSYNASESRTFSVALNGEGTNKVTKSFSVTGQLATHTATIDNPITVTGIQFDAAKRCYVKSITLYFEDNSVATPTFSPAAGYIAKGTKVTISSETPDATIYYTTDNTDPTTGSTPYTADGIVVNEAMTIKAIAVKEGLDNSDIATAEYTIKSEDDANNITLLMNSKKGTGQQMSKEDMIDKTSLIDTKSVDLVSSVAGSNLSGGAEYTIENTGRNAIRIGKYASGAYHEGSFTINLNNPVKIAKIEVSISSYKSSNSKAPKNPTWNLSVNGVEMGAIAAEFVNNKKEIIYTSPTETTEIIIRTIPGSAPVDLQYIEIYSEGATVVKTTPTLTFKHNGINDVKTITYALDQHKSAKAPTLEHDIKTGSQKFTYSSSNSDVATVNANTGEITLMGVGSTSITAAFAGNDDYNSAEASYTLNVTKGTTTLFIVVPDKMKVGETSEILYETNLPPHLLEYLVISSSNTDILSVNGNNITAHDSGEAIITVAYADNENMSGVSESGIVTVEYTMVDALIKWEKGDITCVINNITQPVLTGVPEGVKVSYLVDDNSIATVSEDGKIIPHIPGAFFLTAEWEESRKDENTRYNKGSVECIIQLLSVAEGQRKEGDPKIPTITITEGNDIEGEKPLSVLSYSVTGGYWYIGYNKSLKLKLITDESDATIKYRFVEGAIDFDDITSPNARTQAETPWEDYVKDTEIPFNHSLAEPGKSGSLEFKAVKNSVESPVETVKVSVAVGVDNIEADGNDSDARYFTLQGVEVKNPGNGIFIRVADGKAVKVIR